MAPAPTIDTDMLEPESGMAEAGCIILEYFVLQCRDVSLSFISFSCFNFKGNIFCDETTVVSILKQKCIEFYQIYINKFCSDCTFYRIY